MGDTLITITGLGVLILYIASDISKRLKRIEAKQDLILHFRKKDN